MTTTIFLVRHAQTNSNLSHFYTGWSDEDLNDAGYTQTHRLALRLDSLPITSVYTSPLRRAYSTAQILCQPHKLEPKVLEELIDIRFGDWQGLRVDEINRRWPELWQQWRADPSRMTFPNGEGFSAVIDRAVRALQGIVDASQSQQVVVVTHHFIVKVLVAHVLGVPNNLYRNFVVSAASLSVIQTVNGGFRLVRLNDTWHLEG